MIAKRVTAPNQLDLGLNLSTKKTRKRELLEEMNLVVPWSTLVALIEPHAPRARTDRPPFAIETNQANFQGRVSTDTTWTSNGHLNITPSQ